MSRAFLKDETSGERPIIPPRPALPPNTPNYVTPRGLEQLRAELADLETERAQTEANHDDEANRTWQLTIINGKLSQLTARIATAKVVDPAAQPTHEVRFGATVTLKTLQGGKPGTIRQFTLVGVDEANVAEGRIAFIAPIARVLQGLKINQTATLPLGKSPETVQITAIAYS